MIRVGTRFQQPPALCVLSLDQLEELHLATLEILARTGVNVFHDESLALLRSRGAGVDGTRVRIPAALVAEALDSAPCRVRVADRRGAPAMSLERGRVYFGTGSDVPNTFDLETGAHRPARKQDVADFARLADALEHIDFVMAMAMAGDLPQAAGSVHHFEAMVLNTTKPILYVTGDARDVAAITEMAELIAGGADALAAAPFLVHYAQPSSPLQHGQEALGRLLYCARKGLPVIYIPAPIRGASAPITAAGAIALANAETLSGLVIHQLTAPGAPYIYGAGVPAMDMRTSLCSYASPEYVLGVAAVTALGRYYGLPVFSTAGCADSQIFDQQAGLEAGYSLLAQGLAGGNLIHDLGYLAAGMASSMEMVLLCNETAGMVRHILRGLPLDPKTLALEVIERVGPGGNYFAEEHTLESFRGALHFSELTNRGDCSRWQSEGGLGFGERARERAREILSGHRCPELPVRVRGRLRELAARREAAG